MASRTCLKVPQRQILVMASSISWSVGFGLSFRSAATDMIMPLWQYPHWGTWLATQACCTLFRTPWVARPSMVVICLPTASFTSTPQERIATPSTWTVQAPHCAMPQPYFVPVRPTFSLIAHSSGVSGSTSTSKDFPLTTRFAITAPLVLSNPSIELLVSPIHRSDFMLMLDWNLEQFKSRFWVCGGE